MTSPPANFSDRVSFDVESGEVRDGDVRYMLIRPDGLMGLFRLLDEKTRSQVLAAFADSIFEHGGRSARNYSGGDSASAMSDDEARQLLDVICDTAPRLGWGRWSFQRIDTDTIELSVRNSPFAAGFGSADAAVCAPVSGMFRAVSQLITGRDCVVEEVSCVSVTGEDLCRFISRCQP